MPIRPEMKDRYPNDWKQVRAAILARARNRCEWCEAVNYQPHPETGSQVVLTIAHLDHTPENCDPDNLAALCQKCHNGYDAPNRAAGIRERRAARAGQGCLLFEAETPEKRPLASPRSPDATQARNS